MTRLLHLPSPRPPTPPDPPLLRLLRTQGLEATSFQTLTPELAVWWSPDQQAAVAYREVSGTWVTAGSPVASDARLADEVQAFAQAARDAGKRALFFAVEERTLEALRRKDEFLQRVAWIKIGEQPILDPSRFSLQGRERQNLRAQVRRAENHGVQVREARADELRPSAPLRDAAELLIDAWRDSRRMSPMAFLVDLHPFTFQAERRYFVALRGGVLVGLLACAPVYARDGYFAEDLIRHPAAPNGTAEALLVEALQAFSLEGRRYFTLGLAALSGPLTDTARSARGIPPWLPGLFGFSYARLNFLYSFKGLRAFKDKLRPDRWEPLYLLASPPSLRLPALLALLTAFVPGSRLVFALDTLARVGRHLARRIPPVWAARGAWLCCLTLLPWTAALLPLDKTYWFGASWAAHAWASFDLLLAAAFALLAVSIRHWRRLSFTLARGLLGAVLADAWLTGVQVGLHNLPQATSRLELGICLLAVGAPLLAAAFLVLVSLALQPRDPWQLERREQRAREGSKGEGEPAVGQPKA